MEWLTDAKDARDFFVDEKEGHKRLASWCWGKYQAAKSMAVPDYFELSSYVLRFAEKHCRAVADAEYNAYVRELMADSKFSTAGRVQAIRSDGMCSFYHGEIGRGIVEAHLRGKPPGTFLIRFSKNAGNMMVVSFMDTSRVIKHYRIYTLANGKYSHQEPGKPLGPGVDAREYDGIVDFVVDFQRLGILQAFVPKA